MTAEGMELQERKYYSLLGPCWASNTLLHAFTALIHYHKNSISKIWETDTKEIY